jgi:hypothetical protein
MFFHQRRSFYPFIIALLTLLLAALMFKTLTEPRRQNGTAQSTPPVTESDYRKEAHDVIAPFVVAYEDAQTDVQRLVAVEDALSGILPIVVPPSFKDIHLDLAVALTLMRDGIRAGEDVQTGLHKAGRDKFGALLEKYPWLEN